MNFYNDGTNVTSTFYFFAIKLLKNRKKCDIIENDFQ